MTTPLTTLLNLSLIFLLFVILFWLSVWSAKKFAATKLKAKN